MSESPEQKEIHATDSEGHPPEEPDFGIADANAASEKKHEDSSAAHAPMQDDQPPEKRKIFTKQNLKDLFLGFRSPDKATRKMTGFFYISIFVFIALLGSTGKNWYRSQAAKKKALAALQVEADKKAPHVLKEKEKEAIKLQLNLGEFMLELRPRHEEGDGKAYEKDRMNIATIEIIAECNSVEICHFVEQHIVQVRDQMILMLTGLEREVLMSREGKLKVKRALIEKLNHWLGQQGVSEKGSHKAPIENLYFNRLVLT